MGPLACLQNCDFIPSPLAEAERQEFVARGRSAPVGATLAYHWARMIEALHAVEVIRMLPDDPDILAGTLFAGGTRCTTGVGALGAPRGALIHDYAVGADDLVTHCSLIVSTTNNNQAMNEAVRAVARQYLDGHELTEGLRNRIEVAIRAFDPRLSCATHALGQMPLDVSLLGERGEVFDRVQRDPEEGLRRHVQAATRPDVEFIEKYQLQVEHVIDLAWRSRVLFVDASCACRAPFEVSRPRPARDASFSSHAMSPAALMHACSDLYREPPPPCTLLAIRGRQFELGALPGRSALKHLEQALEWGRGWLAASDEGGDCNLRALGSA